MLGGGGHPHAPSAAEYTAYAALLAVLAVALAYCVAAARRHRAAQASKRGGGGQAPRRGADPSVAEALLGDDYGAGLDRRDPRDPSEDGADYRSSLSPLHGDRGDGGGYERGGLRSQFEEAASRISSNTALNLAKPLGLTFQKDCVILKVIREREACRDPMDSRAE